MTSVIIIDDEDILREGLKSIIDWEEQGCQVIGDAADGESGIKLINQLRPDIVLADVRMPEMGGLEMISQVREQNPKTRFIVLSGYGDFEYTKRAILLGVDAYLLKPVNEDELINIICQITEKIKQENEKENYLQSGEKNAVDLYIHELVENIYKDNQHGISESKILESLSKPPYAVAIISPTGGKNGISSSNKSAEIDTIKRYLTGKSIYNYTYSKLNDGNKIVAIIHNSNTKSVQNDIRQYIYEIKQLYGISTFSVVGDTVKNYRLLNSSFNSAMRFVLNEFLFSHLELIFANEITNFQELAPNENELNIIVEKILSASQILDIEVIHNGVDSLKNIFYNHTYSQHEIISICSNILVEIFNKVANDSSIRHIKRGELLFSLYSAGNMSILLERLKEQLVAVSNLFNEVTADTIVKRVVNYVDRNYSSHITLNILGILFGYNSVYLGRIFKQYSGSNFNDFLETVRIEKAKEMLNGDMKVYQIAEKVGFSNNDYFCSKFKKREGISPTQYKNLKAHEK